MSLTLYGFGLSRSYRCLWALEEAGLTYQYCELDARSDEENGAKHPSYLAKNPQGKVPSLDHDGFLLTESGAILSYINHLGGGGFIPAEGQARAKYDELSFFVMAELEQPLWTTGKHRFAIPEQHHVPAVLDTAKWEFQKALNAMAVLFPFDDYALGTTFSFADCLLAHTFNWAQRFEFDVPAEYLSYCDRLYARPAAVRARERLPSA